MVCSQAVVVLLVPRQNLPFLANRHRRLVPLRRSSTRSVVWTKWSWVSIVISTLSSASSVCLAWCLKILVRDVNIFMMHIQYSNAYFMIFIVIKREGEERKGLYTQSPLIRASWGLRVPVSQKCQLIRERHSFLQIHVKPTGFFVCFFCLFVFCLCIVIFLLLPWLVIGCQISGLVR